MKDINMLLEKLEKDGEKSKLLRESLAKASEFVKEYEDRKEKREIKRKKNEEEAGEWIKVGEIGVDAGMCWIGDPCYIVRTPHTKESQFNDLSELPDNPKAFGEDWGGFIASLDDGQEKSGQPAAQFNYDEGHPGLGVCVDTGYGDGTYDVFILKNKEGRVVEAKVVFIKNEDEK